MTEVQRPEAGAIELRGIVKRFGAQTTVGPIDLTIRQGEFFSLLGPSGCGKTTTLRMLAGFEFPDAGQILLDGADITSQPANRRAMNLVFQRYELFPHMSVARNIGYGLRVAGIARQEIAERVAEIMEVVGVGEMADRRADQLSGGQQQRVALARALVNRPRVLLLDEPLSALDVKLRERMQLELKAIQASLGTTFVYVTHDQEEAMMMSDRIGVMSAGELVQVASPRELYERPATAFVTRFIGAVNELPPLQPGAAPRWVRPERIAIGPFGTAPVGATRVDGVVRDVVYLGAQVRFVVATEHGEVDVRRPSRLEVEEFEVGDRVTLAWD